MMLSEINDHEKDKYCMIFIWGADPQFVESIDEEHADTEGSTAHHLTKELEHPQTLVPRGVLELVPETLRDSYAE